jgi:branched-chain amino acid transport system ATP-binding protein
MLEIADLHVSYGNVQAVRGISVSANPGEITLVLGTNGAGKTTTLRAANGLLPIVSGTVRVDGNDVTGRPTHKLVRHGLSLVPEGRRVFAPLSVQENLLLGGFVTDRSTRLSNLDRVYRLFPILAERRSGPAGLLSGGEQQMLAFGRAMMSRPKVIMMDEPSMGLAPVMVDRVIGAVREIADSGIAVVMVEQNAELGLKVADHVVVVARGESVYTGPAAQARSHAALVRAFLGEAALTS